VFRRVLFRSGLELRTDPDELRLLEAIDGADTVGAAFDAVVRSRPASLAESPDGRRARLLAFVQRALIHGTLVRA